jgi:outer membrane protein assembly factor BamB
VKFKLQFTLFRFAILSVAFALIGGTTTSKSQQSSSRSADNSPAGFDVLTQHNDNDRTGANLRESILTLDNVNPHRFGKIFDLQVDGQVYAQPLVVSDIEIKGKRRNLVVIATEHNTLYAFDRDNGTEIWHKNYGRSARTPNTYFPIGWYDAPYHDLTPEIGITSTPVIDRMTNTVYFTAYVEDENHGHPIWRYWLHAVDLTDPAKPEHFDGPVAIDASGEAIPQVFHEKGRHYSHNAVQAPSVYFEAAGQLQRTALLLTGDQVVLAFGSHADAPPYLGWVLAYDAKHLKKPHGTWISAGREFSGIWQSGMGPTTDYEGNVYLMTGNGFFDGRSDFGDSVVKLELSDGRISLKDYFAPCNQDCMRLTDLDLGSSGLLHLPDTDLLLGGGKEGRLYLLNGKNLHGHPPLVSCDCNNGDCAKCVDDVVQRFQASCGDHIHGSPVYWKSGERGPDIYVWGENDYLRAFPFNATDQRFDTEGCQSSAPAWTVGKAKSPVHNTGMTGGMLSISADQGKNGIVWATTPVSCDANLRAVPGILRAYDANDLTRELWNSYLDLERDDFGNYAKFTPPTISNGKVFVPTFSKHVSVYGLREPTPPPKHVNLIKNGGFEEADDVSWHGEGRSEFYRVENQIDHPCQGPYHGEKYGGLYPTEQDSVGVFQVIDAPADDTYTLTAFCATNIVKDYVADRSLEGTELGVDLDGHRTALVRTIQPNAGYLSYSLNFKAKKGSKIKVWYSAPKMKWDGAPCLVRDKCFCFPVAGCKTSDVDPDDTCKQNPHSAWAAIDAVSLDQGE